MTTALLVVMGIGLVAYTDGRVEGNLSVGYLYALPLILSATAHAQGTTFAFAVVCVALREWLGPFDHAGWQLLVRNGLLLAVFSLVSVVVHRLAEQRRQLSVTVSDQRDQLERELRGAAAVQRRLLPDQLFGVDGLEVAVRFDPARFVAGDLYDLRPGAETGVLGVAVADVAGKGPSAAMWMPAVQVALRMLHAQALSTNDVARELNRVLTALSSSEPKFVSLVYAVVDVQRGHVDYTNLGHPPPMLVRADPQAVRPIEWLDQGGPVAGLLLDAEYQTARLAFDPGDVLVLYTDGVVEAMNASEEFYGTERLTDVVRLCGAKSADALLGAIHQSVEAFRGPDSPRDDTTILVLRRPASRHVDAATTA